MEPKILLECGDNLENGGVEIEIVGGGGAGRGSVTFLLLYSSIAFTVCSGKK